MISENPRSLLIQLTVVLGCLIENFHRECLVCHALKKKLLIIVLLFGNFVRLFHYQICIIYKYIHIYIHIYIIYIYIYTYIYYIYICILKLRIYCLNTYLYFYQDKSGYIKYVYEKGFSQKWLSQYTQTFSSSCLNVKGVSDANEKRGNIYIT